MVHAQSASPRHPIFTALFGMVVLTLGMGVGRFLYTPMLPVMLAEKQLTFNQLSGLPAPIMQGTAGSLLFSFGLFISPLVYAPCCWLRRSPPVFLFCLWRYLLSPRSSCWCASGRRRERGNDDFGSMIVLHHTRHPFVIAALFSGVGAGIALGNEYVIGGLHYALSAHSLWLGAGALAGILLLIVAMLIPRAHALPPAPLARIENQPMPGGNWRYCTVSPDSATSLSPPICR